MARNEEKSRTQLNRLYNAKQEKKDEDKYFIPPLASLETARDVKKYIPRIRREISFCLRQISSKRFRDHKIEEFKERLNILKLKYKSFNKRALHLDPNMVSLPGRKHAYIPKHKIEEMNERRRIALEQNPNGFRHLYGTTNLSVVDEKRPLGWEEVDENETKEKEKETERGRKREYEEEEEEENEDIDAVDKFLEDVQYSDEENSNNSNNSNSNNNNNHEQENAEEYDPDFIPTPLMQQFKKQKVEIDNKEKAVTATGLSSLMGYGSSDED